ncbi:hypothetical protein FB451DRAFT_1183419 [Mycena latifolia]|nr:hypothetical protein FB451DRAFT_1183419 [Mycena latifolia]
MSTTTVRIPSGHRKFLKHKQFYSANSRNFFLGDRTDVRQCKDNASLVPQSLGLGTQRNKKKNRPGRKERAREARIADEVSRLYAWNLTLPTTKSSGMYASPAVIREHIRCAVRLAFAPRPPPINKYRFDEEGISQMYDELH